MTFHLRVVTTGEVTERVVALLAAEPGVSNLVVLPGAARRPAGDAVQCDVRSSAANSVLTRLKACCDPGAGPVAIEVVDAVVGERPSPAAKFGVVQRDIAPVWDVVDAKIRSDAVYAPSFYTLLAIAGLIGAVAILINSQILLVGRHGRGAGIQRDHGRRARHRPAQPPAGDPRPDGAGAPGSWPRSC